MQSHVEEQEDGVPTQGTPEVQGTPGTTGPGLTQGTPTRDAPVSDSSGDVPLPPGEFYGIPSQTQGEPNVPKLNSQMYSNT